MFLRRLARSLVVAGTCGLAPVALAQTGIPLPPISQGISVQAAPVQAAPVQTAPVQVASGASRLEAIKVEVALLGDPVTYAQAVEVRLENDTIVLVGRVEDEVTRKRIVEVARQNCYLPVSDAMSTVARTSSPAVLTAPLHASARDALVRQMGSKADRFQIATTEDGRLTIKGEVSSAEEKLAASRALRGLAGCTRVVNCLSIRTLEQAGHAITVVSSDGQSVVFTPITPKDGDVSSTPVQRVHATEEIQPTLPRVQQAAGASDVVASGLPNTRTVNVTTIHNGKEVTRPVMYVVPTASGYATSSPVQATPLAAPAPHRGACPTTTFHEGVVMHEAQPVEKKPGLFRGLFAWKSARLRKAPMPELTAGSPLGGHPIVIPSGQPIVIPPITTPAVAQPVVQVAPPQEMKPVFEKVVPQETKPVVVEVASAPRLPEPVVQAPAVVSPIAQETKPAAETVTPLPAPTPVPLPVPAPVATKETWPPAHDIRPVTATPPEGFYRSRPLAGVASRMQGRPAVEVAVPAPVAPTLIPAPVAKPAPLTQTVAKLPPAPVEPAAHIPTAAPEPMRMTSRDLIDRIKATCGKLVRDVKVETAADRKIVVHVYAKPATDHLIVGKLLQMPELAASNVRLQLHLTN